MIYYRSPTSPDGASLSLGFVRILLLVSLAAYPAGAAILDMTGTSRSDLAGLFIGFGLITLSYGAAMPILGSRFQRIVGESVDKLDEFELKLRQRATSTAYAVFTGVALLATLYAAIASEAGLWVPQSYGEYNGLFWGIFLYSALLPTVFLVWVPRNARELVDTDEEAGQ